MGRSIGIGVCILGFIIVTAPMWWNVVRPRDDWYDLAPDDWFAWTVSVGRCLLTGVPLIYAGVQILLKY